MAVLRWAQLTAIACALAHAATKPQRNYCRESLCFRPAALRSAFRPVTRPTATCPIRLPGDHFDRDIAARTYAEHIAIWKELDDARLRRRRLERASHHAARPDEFAQHDGGGRRAAHQKSQVPAARQSVAAAQSAAHRRGTGDGRLPVARAHPVGLRARRAARIQGLQRADVGIARAVRGGDRHHPEGVDRECLQL